jgi:hypothetical protein
MRSFKRRGQETRAERNQNGDRYAVVRTAGSGDPRRARFRSVFCETKMFMTRKLHVSELLSVGHD